jgi:amino acid transporter
VLANSESPHVLAASAILGRTGQIWIGIVTVLATVSTINTLIMAISRMLYSMAREGQLPSVFGLLNRWGSPWVATIFMTAIFCIFIIAGIANAESITALILAGAFCWFVTYIIAHLNVIILRYKHPDVKRTFKSPLGITFQVIGILGMIYMMINIFPDLEVKSQIYRFALIFLAITIIYSLLWVKFVMKKELFEITPLEKLIEDVGGSSVDEPELTGGATTVKS